MTFKELCAWLKQTQYPNLTVEDSVEGCETIFIGNDENAIAFDIAGIISVNGDIIAATRSPEQMKRIIENLFEEVTDEI